MVVQSDYSVSSLSEKESKERERERESLTIMITLVWVGSGSVKDYFLFYFLVHYVQKIICRHLTFFMYWGRVGILIYHLAQI